MFTVWLGIQPDMHTNRDGHGSCRRRGLMQGEQSSLPEPVQTPGPGSSPLSEGSLFSITTLAPFIFNMTEDKNEQTRFLKAVGGENICL